jgi:NAD(P)-dependent dehydrogenase (short-subunit alcohol dehydrogenase family)
MPGLESYTLTGKRALVTGAAGLLGQQHAIALAELGADVILTDIEHTRLEAALRAISPMYPGRFQSAIMDVSCASSIQDAANTVGNIDVLINNAALDPKASPGGTAAELSRFENLPLGEWNRQISVGLTGTFLCSQVFGTAMAARGHGVIVNVASDLSIIAPDQRLYRKEGVADERQPVKPVTYSVIKTGLVGLTRYLAAYWAAAGVRVNAISPGGVFHSHSDEFVSRLTHLIPMGRMAHVTEYRAAIQFLASPASSYMTGHNLVIDGGRTVL